jgi:hypothetical protein
VLVCGNNKKYRLRDRNVLTEKFNQKAGAIAIKTAKILLSAVAVSLIIPAAVFYKDWKQPPGQELTKNEIALAQGIFGKDFDASAARKNLEPVFNGHGNAVYTNGRHVYFRGKPHLADDYALADPTPYSEFVHEMTHVWKNQTGNVLKNAFDYISCDRGIYDYELSESSRFDDFCMEQQAAIVADYATQFLNENHYPFWTHYVGASIAKGTPLLKKVVEDRFPEAQKTRLEIERIEKSRSPIIVTFPEKPDPSPTKLKVKPQPAPKR